MADTTIAFNPPTPNQNFGPIPQLDGMTFREFGNSGLRAFGGYVREEFLPALQGRQGATMYREMSDNSPIIGAIIYAIQATMKKVDWRVLPADDTPAAQEAADFVESIKDDMSHTWEDSIAEGLSMLVYGYAPQEINYKRRSGNNPGMDPQNPGKRLPKSKYNDGKIGWRSLPLRGQDTIIKWFFDNHGGVMGLTQQPWVGALVDIPIEKLLLFRPSQHKGNPEGRSILRNAYRPYYMIKRMEEQEAILYERLNGIPVIKVPSSLTEQALLGNVQAAAAMNQFKAMAVNLRIDEQMGLVLPSDMFEGPTGPSTAPQYSLELVSPGGGKSSTAAPEVIVRHQNNILMSVLADFLSLGHGKTGTQALADNKADMFFQSVEAALNGMAAVYNRHGLKRLWELNGMDEDLMPTIEPDLAQRVDLDVLGNYIKNLAGAGMALFPSADLETALLDAGGLPDIADPAARDAMAEGEGPVAIVGPGAAIAINDAIPQPGMPGGPPLPSAGGKSNFKKMLDASIARRVMKRQGPTYNIRTRAPE